MRFIVGTMLAYLARKFKGGYKVILSVFGIQVFFLLASQYLFIGYIKAFLDFKPIDPNLAASIKSLAARLNFPENDLRILNSKVVNAFFTGLWLLKAIIFHTAILQMMPPDQVVAVMGHELGHWNYLHIPILLLEIIIKDAIMLVIARRFMASEKVFKDMGYNQRPPLLIRYMQFMLLVPLFEFIFSPIRFTLSQLKEYQADGFAKKLGYGPTLQQALITLAKEDGYEEVSIFHWLYAAFNSTHPTVPMRVRALRG